MSRYIDVEPLDVVGTKGVSKDYAEGMAYVLDLLDNLPIADVVEVVRCKDCKYMTEHYDVDGNAPYWTCSEWDSGTDYDGYCSYGERKEK